MSGGGLGGGGHARDGEFHQRHAQLPLSLSSPSSSSSSSMGPPRPPERTRPQPTSGRSVDSVGSTSTDDWKAMELAARRLQAPSALAPCGDLSTLLPTFLLRSPASNTTLSPHVPFDAQSMGIHPLDRFGLVDDVYHQIAPLLLNAHSDYLRFDEKITPNGTTTNSVPPAGGCDSYGTGVPPICADHPLMQKVLDTSNTVHRRPLLSNQSLVSAELVKVEDGVTFLAELEKNYLIPLESQFLSLPAETQSGPTESDTGKKRKRRGNVKNEISGMRLDSTASDAMSVASEVDNGPSQETKACPPPAAPESPAKKPAKKVKKLDSKDSSKMDWKLLLRKCSATLLRLLSAYDEAAAAAHEGRTSKLLSGNSKQGAFDFASLVDENGVPKIGGISQVSRHVKKIVDAGKGPELISSIREEAGENDESMADAQTATSVSAESQSVARFLKLCEAALQRLELIDCGIKTDGAMPAPPGTPRKNRGASKGSKKHSEERVDSNGEITDDVDSPSALEEVMKEGLDKVAIGAELCVACVEILKAEALSEKSLVALSRKVYSEDLMNAILAFLKRRLDDVLFDSLDTAAKAEVDSNVLARSKAGVLESADIKKRLGIFVDRVCDILKTLGELLLTERFADSIIVQIYSLSLSPFFWEASPMSSIIGVEKIQAANIGVLRSLFANFPSHRTSIMEDIVGNLVKLPTERRGLRSFRLHDGKSVQMVSALVIQLVQSCCFGRDIPNAAEEFLNQINELRRIESEGPVNGATDLKALQSQAVAKFCQACKQGMDAANQCALFFLKYLITRSFTSSPDDKVNKRKSLGTSSGETEHRFVLENFLADASALLGDVEWPGAEIIVAVISKILMTALDERKQGDTPLKAMALDWVGEISSKIRARSKAFERKVVSHHQLSGLFPFTIPLKGPITIELVEAELPPPDITAQETNSDHIFHLWESESIISEFLSCGAEQDPGLFASKVFYLAAWASSVTDYSRIPQLPDETHKAIIQLYLEYCDSIRPKGGVRRSRFRFTTVKKPLWNLASESVTIESRSVANIAATLLQRRGHVFSDVFRNQLLSRILSCLESETITVRSRALKALSDVVHASEKADSPLQDKNVKNVVRAKILDISKSVREAAIELAGTCLRTAELESPTFLEYYEPIKSRLKDIGQAVRKRVIKLLKDVALRIVVHAIDSAEDITSSRHALLVDISCQLLGRLSDEEDSVRDLARRTLYELWFMPFKHMMATVTNQLASRASLAPRLTSDPLESFLDLPREQAYASLSATAKREVMLRANLLVGIVESLSVTGSSHNAAGSAVVTGSADPVGDLLQTVMDGKVSKTLPRDVIAVARSLVEAVVEKVFVCEAQGTKDTMKSCFILLFQISKVVPCLMAPHVKMLHPYLKQSSPDSGPDEKSGRATEERLTGCVVSVLGSAIPFLLEPDHSFMASIEIDLISLLSRRSLGVVVITVPCICAIVERVTKNYQRLTRVLKMCIDTLVKTKALLESGQTLTPVFIHNATRCLVIMALLVRYFDFDKLQKDFTGAASEEFQSVVKFSQTSILNTAFSQCIFFASSPTSLSSVGLQSLGHLFVSHPRLMQRDDARDIMASVFRNGSIAQRIDLVKVFGEYLRSEQAKMASEESSEETSQKGESVDIHVLIGNADEMADAGVSSAIMQMYLDYLLESLFSLDPVLTTVAFDVVCIILEQGLVHPVLCIPHVVAMQTSDDVRLSSRAVAIYEYLADKHQSLIHTKNGDCVKKAFEYRKASLAKSLGSSSVWVPGFVTVHDTSHDVEGTEKPLALFSKMYSKIQAKKNRRNDFLSMLVRVFEFDAKPPLGAAPEENVDLIFSRFVADNLATLDYKNVDEVFHVVHHICKILSLTGEMLQSKIQELMAIDSAAGPDVESLAKRAILMCMLILLKSHLQSLYNVTEDQCRRYTPSDFTKVGERNKAAARATDRRCDIAWETLAFASSRVMETREDMLDQCRMFIEWMDTTYFGYDELAPISDVDGAAPTTPARPRLSSTRADSQTTPITPLATPANPIKLPKRSRTSSVRSTNGRRRNSTSTAPDGGGGGGGGADDDLAKPLAAAQPAKRGVKRKAPAHYPEGVAEERPRRKRKIVSMAESPDSDDDSEPEARSDTWV